MSLKQKLEAAVNAPISWRGPLPNEAIAAVQGDRERLKPILEAMIECEQVVETFRALHLGLRGLGEGDQARLNKLFWRADKALAALEHLLGVREKL